MKHRRPSFRRRGGTPCNAAYFGYMAAFRGRDRREVEAEFKTARYLCTTAPKPLPGETHRQLAARLRAEAAPAEAPAKGKRAPKKAAA